jgi:isoquinoline 1-oxidoreductase alpha subunit
VASCEGKKIVTVEGLAESDKPSLVQQAWIKHQVPQCGYCQSGMIMAVESLLTETQDPNDQDIDRVITNICRCGTYQRARAAIKDAALVKRRLRSEDTAQ